MKLAEALRYCVLVILLLSGIWGLPQDQPSSKTPAGLTLTRCDDIPIDANLGGVLLIDGHVMCPDNNMKWILVTEHSVIRTKDGKGLEMTNVGFVVDPGIHLFFVAPTIILRKNKNTPPHALIQTEGVVDFWTNALHASFTGASPVDRRQLILPVDDGFVYAPDRILFSRTAIYAGDPAASATDEESNILPSQIPSASQSIGKQRGVENAAPGSSKTPDVTADGDEDTPISDEDYHIEGDETGHTSASPTNGGSDSLSLPDSADTATAAAAGTVVDNRGEQADTDQPRNINTDAEEVGGTAPSDHVSDLDARIALGFSVVDAADDNAAAIAAAFDHAAADAPAASAAAATDVTSADADAAAAAGMASAAAGGGGGTHSGDSDESTAQLPHPPSASSGLSSSEQTSAAADGNGVLDGADVLGQPGGSMVHAEDIGDTVSSNGVPASAARGASAAAFEPASADGDAAADPDATAAAAAAAAVGSTVHRDDDSNTPKTLPLQPGFEEAEQATTAVESGGVSSSSDGTSSSPPNAHSVPGRVLKVGEGLRGRVFNSHGTAATYASPSDGSILLETSMGDGGHMDGRPVGLEAEKPTVLVQSNAKKVARVLERRADIYEENREEGARVAAGGARKSGGALGNTVMGWLPFGRKGFLEKRKREHARAHLGEVEMRLSDRGKVEVTMDGTEVLSKAGPSFFGYRRKDPTFQYRTTDNGFEVLRRGKHVWGVTAESG